MVTKHQKEQAIAPILYNALGIDVEVNSTFDTDTLGTFTGEVKREQNAKVTVLNKCLAGLKNSSHNIGIASEGSFGAHPEMSFLPFNEEWLVWVDQKRNIILYAKSQTIETNFFQATIGDASELEPFLNQIQFPSHGVIIKNEAQVVIAKNNFNQNALLKTVQQALKSNKTVLLETDMRAMYNPTRMLNIKAAAKKLVEQLEAFCPNCNTPGFVISDYEPGLPCELCSFPSQHPKTGIKKCTNCDHHERVDFPNGQTTLDAQYCQFCNP